MFSRLTARIAGQHPIPVLRDPVAAVDRWYLRSLVKIRLGVGSDADGGEQLITIKR